MSFYVYEHWRTDKDECFYVGKGKSNRAYSMKFRNRHHKAIMAKLSREGFAMEVRIVASNLTENEAFDFEVQRIAFWRSVGADLVNILPGGLGGPTWTGKKHSAETKEKMSIAAKGNKANTGRNFSEEHRRKLSQSQIGNKKALGRVDSDETRNKKSISLKGKKNALGRKQSESEKSMRAVMKKEWWLKKKEVLS